VNKKELRAHGIAIGEEFVKKQLVAPQITEPGHKPGFCFFDWRGVREMEVALRSNASGPEALYQLPQL
jgi:hypothetical protein